MLELIQPDNKKIVIDPIEVSHIRPDTIRPPRKSLLDPEQSLVNIVILYMKNGTEIVALDPDRSLITKIEKAKKND